MKDHFRLNATPESSQNPLEPLRQPVTDVLADMEQLQFALRLIMQNPIYSNYAATISSEVVKLESAFVIMKGEIEKIDTMV